MVLSIGERIKGFLFSPSETFDASMEDTIDDAFKYYVVILAIYAVLYTIKVAVVFSLFAETLGVFGVPAMPFGVAMAIGVFVVVLVSGIIGIFIGGPWLHIWVYLVGGRNGIEETTKAVIYGMTPGFLLGWIPIVGTIGGIWALIVGIVGVRQLQELSTGKAVLAVIIAIIIPAIIIGVLWAAFMVTMPGPGFGGFLLSPFYFLPYFTLFFLLKRGCPTNQPHNFVIHKDT